MTQKHALSITRSLRNTELTDDVIAGMLSELEGRIAYEIHGAEHFEDTGELSVPHPFDRVYWTFLVAMLDLYEGNLQSYQHTYAEFCRAFSSYANHYQRRRA